MCISKACFPTCWISCWCAWRMSWGQGRKARVGEAGEQKWPVPGAWIRGWVQRVVGQLTEPQRRVCVLVLLALQPALSIIHRLHVALFYICVAFSHLGNKTAGISYLRVCDGDDKAIRSSYRLQVSLLQLALTVALQLNNLRQRAQQEWRQHRNLPSRSQSVEEPNSPCASRCIL